METLQENISEYKRQMQIGVIPKAYKALIDYLMYLRSHFSHKYPDYYVSGNIYPGYMDMSYFSIVPENFKRNGLKVAVVFIHEKCSFEIWLAGYNKQIQSRYWEIIKDSNWKKYHLVLTIQGADSILESVVIENPDFNDVNGLTSQIEEAVIEFIKDIETHLDLV